MPKHTLTGNIKRHRAFHSRVLGNQRDVFVYLPPGYRRFSSRRYPVLYMHDGQNVFDAATSFAGVEWGVDETAQRLIHRKLIEPLIIVAVANIGEERVDEYAIFRLVGILGEKPPLKIWLDTGTGEPGWELTRYLRDYLIDKGWQPGVDLSYLEVKGANHSEAAWATRVEPALRFLFPPVK